MSKWRERSYARWPFDEPGWADYSEYFGGPLEAFALRVYAVKISEYEFAIEIHQARHFGRPAETTEPRPGSGGTKG